MKKVAGPNANAMVRNGVVFIILLYDSRIMIILDVILKSTKLLLLTMLIILALFNCKNSPVSLGTYFKHN